MILCNSQREEGLVPSQICRTSNRATPQNYKINLEPIFNFLFLFYWIIVEKTSMRNCAKEIFLLRRKLLRGTFFKITSGRIVQKLFSWKRSEWVSSHHRKMMFEGDWGCCPNKRICKNREPVQVYIACQFVKLYSFALLATLCKHKMIGKLFPPPG